MKTKIIGGILVILFGIFSYIYMEKHFKVPATSWDYSTPEAVGFDSETLTALLETIQSERIDIHSMILMRDRHVFLEFYSYPYTKDTPQHTMSVGKSMLSALTGIALSEGKVSALDTPMIKSFPELRNSISDPRKQQITLRHALTMTTGLDIGDDNPAAIKSITQSPSWIEAAWQRPVNHAPGDSYTYGSFISHLIAQTLQRNIKEDLLGYGRKKLFQPIGIEGIQAERDPEGNWFGGGGLWMKATDMLRFGMLYLQDGQWGKQQIVPERWVSESTQNQIGRLRASSHGIPQDKYGYHWWVFGEDSYAAVGVGGQMIFVIPDLEFLAVITRADTEFDIIGEILKALTSPYWPESENPESVSNLMTLIQEMGTPSDARPQTLPQLSKRISGKTYRVTETDKTLPLHSFSLRFDQGSGNPTLSIQSNNTKSEIILGTPDKPFLNRDIRMLKRPDGKSLYSAWMEWENETHLVLDFHEIGYPVKYRWNLSFIENSVNVSIASRGAASSRVTFTAHY